MSSKQTDESHILWHTGAGTLRGHEDITRFAVDIANQQMTARPDLHYEKVPYGVHGPLALHPLVKGNFETDFPSQELRQFYGANPMTDWHNDANLQHIHGLRNRNATSLANNLEACQATSSAIVNALRSGELWHKNGDRYRHQYWIGHALHILQDTFSPAHVIRTGAEGTLISDFCTYRVNSPGVCYHHEVDPRDRIWRTDSLKCTFDSDHREWFCLTVEAQYAALASADLLAELAQGVAKGEASDQIAERVLARRLNCASL